MRLRNISGSREMIADSKYVIQDAENQKGKIKTYFEKEQPIRIEIGMGKGRFIMQMAEENPEINFIGIEKDKAYVAGAQKRIDEVAPIEAEGALEYSCKRKQPRIPFGTVVERGLLTPGTVLYDSARKHKAVIRSDGTIKGEDVDIINNTLAQTCNF